MQVSLALPSHLPLLRDRLRQLLGPQLAQVRLDPVSQLIHAVLSARTYEEVSWAAFMRLRAATGDWARLAEADVAALEQIIDPVTFADRKARQLPVLVRVLRLKRGSLDLEDLRAAPVSEAMAWLMSLPGVGAKAAAATLNFSTLDRPVLVVDTHVARVARRLGLAGRGDAQEVHERLMSEVPADWTAADLRELHSLMKAHGQSLCDHFDPACHLCALRTDCPRTGVGASGQVLAFRDRPRNP